MPVAQKFFTVRGRGPFPIDMLRYDSAWPVDTADAQKIADSFDPDMLTARWEVQLHSADRTAPTTARWNSFNTLVPGHGGVAERVTLSESDKRAIREEGESRRRDGR